MLSAACLICYSKGSASYDETGSQAGKVGRNPEGAAGNVAVCLVVGTGQAVGGSAARQIAGRLLGGLQDVRSSAGCGRACSQTGRRLAARQVVGSQQVKSSARSKTSRRLAARQVVGRLWEGPLQTRLTSCTTEPWEAFEFPPTIESWTPQCPQNLRKRVPDYPQTALSALCFIS